MSGPRQPRHPAGTPLGGRFAAFASPACPTTYRLLAAAPDGGLLPGRPDPENPARTVLAPPRCPHGHWQRWALGVDGRGRPNCPPCAARAAR